jgi:hypothetical protein
MYVYLPGFQRVRRMGTHVSKQSFMGSDFSSEDMAQLELAQSYDAKAAGGDDKAWVLDLQLKAGKQAEFPRLKMWVDKASAMMTRLEYYDPAGKKAKTQERGDLQKLDGGWVARTVTMTDHRRGDHASELHNTVEAINKGLGSDVFSVRSLQRGQ